VDLSVALLLSLVLGACASPAPLRVSDAGGAGTAGASGSDGLGGSLGSGSLSGSGGTLGDGGMDTHDATPENPCVKSAMLDRSCVQDADCFAVQHEVNCCRLEDIGLNVSQKAQSQNLEAQCKAIYGVCGCVPGPPIADDGSTVAFGVGAVACVHGVCTTYSPACNHPCTNGLSCHSCNAGSVTLGTCSAPCTDDTSCTDPALPSCQVDIFGDPFCAAADLSCIPG
jgi:hypothetical protein